MKKILLPTDFSDNSWNAIKYAIQLYKEETCSFILLHTYSPAIYQFEYMQSSSVDFQVMEAMEVNLKNKLDVILKKIEANYSNPKHSYSQQLSINSLTASINEYYNEDDAVDMIIMGTKGASGAKEILFGSNTIHILKNAKCPVLAIPDNFDFEAPIEVLFPSDYEVTLLEKHIQPIVDIAALYHSRVNILHVSYGYDLTEKQERNRKKLEESLKAITPLFHDVRNQNVPEAITEFQMKVRVNLLVMINNKHSFFENLFFKSTINQIGFHLNIPFLVIPSRI